MANLEQQKQLIIARNYVMTCFFFFWTRRGEKKCILWRSSVCSNVVIFFLRHPVNSMHCPCPRVVWASFRSSCLQWTLNNRPSTSGLGATSSTRSTLYLLIVFINFIVFLISKKTFPTYIFLFSSEFTKLYKLEIVLVFLSN